MSRSTQNIYRFDRFALDAERRLLTDETGTAVDLTPKATDILCLLVENNGQLVTKEEIMQTVWADSFVEEANLSHHIFKLRKALGETGDRKLIETVPKRGYRFVGELRTAEPTSEIDPDETIQEEVTIQTRRAPVIWIAVGAAAVVLLAAGWYLYSRRAAIPSEPSSAAVRSIAVMPFVNESGNEEVDYLSDGMTETLINSLSEVSSLSVKSRPAVFRYKGRDVAYSTLASELNVQALLFGRLTLRGNDITLFLSLIDPHSENQIWGKQYVRKLSDLVALQDEIGRDVAQSLEARLTAAAEDKLSKQYSRQGEAYRLYLLGDYYWGKFTKNNFLRAKKHYEEAIAIDPNYALAHTGIANTYAVLGVNGHIPATEAAPKARAAAERALQIDPQLAEAHLSIGACKMFFDWDLSAADEHFKKAMELDRAYAVPHALLGYSLRARRRFEEALAEGKRANELDPLNLLNLGDIGVCYRFMGQPEKALEINERMFEMDPNFGDGRFENGLVLSDLGRYDDALEEITRALSLADNSTKIKAGLGIVHAKAGDNGKAKKVIDELLANAKETYVSPMDIALIYSTMGEKDKAFEWLEKAYVERTPWLFELRVTPEFAPLRGDPRFEDLAKRIGL